MRVLAFALAAAWVASSLGCGKGIGSPAAGDSGTAAIPSTATAVTTLTPVAPSPPALAEIKSGPLSFAPIAKLADPSVVTISTVGEEVEESPLSRRVRSRETRGLGTGFLIQKDGVILTNNHVVNDAETITVKLSDDRQFPARIVGRDKATDMAVVKIEANDLPTLTLGDSDIMEIGDWVVAIGNPFGLSHTVSAGIISAKKRTRDDVPLGDPSGYYDFMQTDASINPGNSGGPLLNLRGEVVGINTAIRGGGAQGIGFAIPINMVKQLLPMLLRDGHVTRSALGVRLRDVRELSPEDRATLKLVDPAGKPLLTSGALVEWVGSGGPADKSGIVPGDVIVAFEGQPIERIPQLQWLTSTYGVGKQATVRVARAGKAFDLRVTLAELPDAEAARKRTVQALPPGYGPP